MNHVDLFNELRRRELPGGGWSFFGSPQMSLEATCLATFSVLAERPLASPQVVRPLLRAQLSNGSWPSFIGDGESSWTTALAICALNSANDSSGARERGQSWLLTAKGREGSWFWRWKFKLADRAVRFDPDLYGWPWLPGSASWVIPTAFSVIAIKQFTACNRTEATERRIRLGVDMLLDRVCVGGGWNSGNSVVYAAALPAHVEATAIALLALQDEKRDAGNSGQSGLAQTRGPPASSRWRVSPGASLPCSCTKSRSSISERGWRRSSGTVAKLGTTPLWLLPFSP